MRTPWPLFSLSMLQADIIGALFVLGFLRYALPPEDRIQLQDLPVLNLAIFGAALVVVFITGLAVTLRLLLPVFRWQRRDNMLAEADPAATELARSRALRLPFYRTLSSSRRARMAMPAARVAVGRALQRGGEAQRRHRAPRARRTGDQPSMCHSPGAGFPVACVTTCGSGGGQQLGRHRVLAYQPRKHPGHHR